MRILTYKRTHTGDPDCEGRFGIYDCMGRIRNLNFDAVIGVGGVSREPRSFGIDRKINWVGINPTKRSQSSGDGLVVTFEKFRLMEELGPFLYELAPFLDRRMFENGARYLLTGYSVEEQEEAELILKWSLVQPPIQSDQFDQASSTGGCFSRCRAVTNTSVSLL